MSRVLALVDRSPVTAAVKETAVSMCRLLDSTLDLVEVQQDSVDVDDRDHVRRLRGEPETALLDELTDDDVVLAVLGSRSLSAKPEVAGHVALSLLQSAPIPLLVVPPGSSGLSNLEPRVLVPLDGESETDAALLTTARALADSSAVVHVLHVYDSSSLPPFLGSSEDIEVLAREFLAQHVTHDVGACELRIGDAASQILEVAKQRDIDLILIAWGQDLAPGRAEIVRRLLRNGVPLLLVPRTRR